MNNVFSDYRKGITTLFAENAERHTSLSEGPGLTGVCV